MKVLQVNSVIKKGSTGIITYNLHKGITQNEIDSIICYGRGEKIKERSIYKVCGEYESHFYKLITMFSGLMYGSCYKSTERIKKIIDYEKPDIVHLQCINGYFVNIYKLIDWLKNKKIATVVTLHAEFMFTANCGHSFECVKWMEGCGSCPQLKKETHSLFLDNTHMSWKMMKEAFDGFENIRIVSVSPWLMDRASKSPILHQFVHRVVYNGVDTSVFHYYSSPDLKNEIKIFGDKIVFHATPFFSTDPQNIKGGYYVCEAAKKMPDYTFVIAGTCVGEIRVPDNVVLLGKIEDPSLLAKLYSIANVTLLTSRRETFSMVTAESLCCGTPVVAFKSGGPEQIAIKEYSDFYDYGDADGIVEGIKKMSVINNKIDISKCAIRKYSIDTMINNYIDIYYELLENKTC